MPAATFDSAPASHRFALDPSAAIALRRWGGEYVCHHLQSNETYRLTAIAGETLEALSRGGAVDASELTATVAAHDAKISLPDTLEALEALGLVTKC